MSDYQLSAEYWSRTAKCGGGIVLDFPPTWIDEEDPFAHFVDLPETKSVCMTWEWLWGDWEDWKDVIVRWISVFDEQVL